VGDTVFLAPNRVTGMTGSAEEPDGGRDVDFDEQVLYLVVRKAVEDAIIGVLGTLSLLVVAFVVVWIGATFAVSGQSTVGLVAGIAVVVFGFYLAAVALELVSPVWDWF
jgi:hypothetical protein